MDRSKVGAARSYWTPSTAAPAISDEACLDCLKDYWKALGVSDPYLALALSEQTLRRLVEPARDEESRLARAIIAAGELLDDWLANALELPRPSRMLTAARAALLSGAAPDWPAALFAPPGAAGPALEQIRLAIAEPTPASSPSAMPAQRIELFSWLSFLRLRS
ncbi:MAG: hypothetical protein KDJ22_10245 [Candidatus Competibacteraceae bacterium]|nr:hypothetical protein [Candidatus Competibacteraceae bacterium]MCP5125331.1 hypothetical protein [Gammaproteobacteria bacterium]HRX70237.1 hypothetical protein [Candidatus Competibacteraceae bacterium]